MTVITHSHLRLEASALALRGLGGWLRDAIEQLPDEQVAATLLPRAELALHEACMNVVDHAQLPAGEGIEVELVLSADRLVLTVRDRGKEFHPSEVPEPQRAVLQERGYGVKIIRSLVSDLSLRRVESTNVLELTINLGEHP